MCSRLGGEPDRLGGCMFAEHADAFTRYLQLIINRDEGYNAFEMAMLSQGVDGIIKPKLNLDSQGLTYFFDIGGLVKLEQILTNPSVDELFVLKLLLQVVELNETICGHMLALEQIYWSLDYVYCNQIDRKIHLIYLPLSSANLLCSMSYKEFIDVIISKHLCSSVVTSSVQIKSYLNDPYFCQKGFKNLIVSLKKALETVITNDEANLGLTYSSVTDKAESVNKGNATRKSNVQKRWIVNVILVLVCVLIWFMLPLVTRR